MTCGARLVPAPVAQVLACATDARCSLSPLTRSSLKQRKLTVCDSRTGRSHAALTGKNALGFKFIVLLAAEFSGARTGRQTPFWHISAFIAFLSGVYEIGRRSPVSFCHSVRRVGRFPCERLVSRA